MNTTNPTAAFNEFHINATSWINRGLECLWLLTVLAIPLVFVEREAFLSELELAYVDVPKTVVLRTLVGLMSVLWLTKWALTQGAEPLTESLLLRRSTAWPRSFKTWLLREPANWVALAVVLYLVSTLLSTILSESFSVSMWGLVPGQDTYPAYTITSYVILFGVIATNINSKAQVDRLLWTIAIMGVVVSGYSWAQFYGWDIFSLREIPGALKSGSTLGNSILAGSVLLMTITISLVTATNTLSRQLWSVRFWAILSMWTFFLTLQTTALIFSWSRGPWGGTIAALVVLLALVAMILGWRTLVRMALVLGLTAGLTAAILHSPPPIPRGHLITIGYQEYQPPAQAISIGQDVLLVGQEFAASGRNLRVSDVSGAGLSGRIGIWKTSGRLIAKRPWFESSPPSLQALRHLIGYGPDMFKYTYLLAAEPRGRNMTPIPERFAHNIIVHRGVELGLLGILTTLGLFAAPICVCGYQLLRRRRHDSTFYNLVMVGILAALAGRFIEQMVGVAAVSDLTVFWALLGIFDAIPNAANTQKTVADSDSTPRQALPAHQSVQGHEGRIYRAQVAIPIAVAACLIVGIGSLTWTKSINYLEAGFDARAGLDGILDGNFKDALASLDQAIDLAPDVAVYHTLRASVFSAYLEEHDGPKEPQCAQLEDTESYDTCLARKAFSSHLEASERRPLDWRHRLILAESALTLGLSVRDPEMTGEAIRLYREVAQLDPRTWWHWEWLGAAYIQVGQPESALGPIKQSLEMQDGIPSSINSRLIQGMAYLHLNEPEMAVKDFDEVININPKSPNAYANRGASYNALGQYQRAIQDLDEAIVLNPKMAVAYNNRGTSYGNLDQLIRAIEDYDEAIRLDPQSVLAYSNRALAYMYLGRDNDALMDVERGIALGLDPRSILARIEQIKNSR